MKGYSFLHSDILLSIKGIIGKIIDTDILSLKPPGSLELRPKSPEQSSEFSSQKKKKIKEKGNKENLAGSMTRRIDVRTSLNC